VKAFRAVAVLCLGLLPVFAYADTPTLSSTEKTIADYISARSDEQLRLLERLVNINSGTQNVEGVRQVGEGLRPEFESIGFKTHWVELPPDMQRAGMLVAERDGTRGQRLLLIGHLDTVFPKDSPFGRFERRGNVATGPGVIDDKGGIVVLLYALKALNAAQILDEAQITIALTGDEENSGKPTSISRKPLIALAKNSDVVLDFEPTIPGHASTGRRGVAHWLITTTGNEGHSSIIFSKGVGYGAVFEMARILDRMNNGLRGEHGLTLNPGIILGGTQVDYDRIRGRGDSFGRTNIVAGTAIAHGDLRYLSNAQREQARQKLAEITSRNLPGTSASLEFTEVLPPMPTSAESTGLFDRYSAISERLGYGKVELLPAERRGGGDISFIAPYISAGLVGIGANGTGEHSPQESLEVDSLVKQAQRAALLMHELLQPRERAN